jgi:hypothetical protein
VRRLLEADEPPRYERASQGSKLDPFEPVIRRVHQDWPEIKAPRMTQLLRGPPVDEEFIAGWAAPETP